MQPAYLVLLAHSESTILANFLIPMHLPSVMPLVSFIKIRYQLQYQVLLIRWRQQMRRMTLCVLMSKLKRPTISITINNNRLIDLMTMYSLIFLAMKAAVIQRPARHQSETSRDLVNWAIRNSQEERRSREQDNSQKISFLFNSIKFSRRLNLFSARTSINMKNSKETKFCFSKKEHHPFIRISRRLFTHLPQVIRQ